MGRILWAVYPFSPPRSNPELALSQDQQQALDTLLDHVERAAESSDRVVMVLTGAAGTGKTTIMKEMARRVQPLGFSVMYAAPTGKAAARLRESTGEETSTLHSFLYGTPVEKGICPNCNQVSEALGRTVSSLRREGFSTFVCPHCGTSIPFSQKDSIAIELHWEPNEKLMQMGDKVLLIVDESSMVGPLIYEDVLKMVPPKWPILWVGDREQLKPVPSPMDKQKFPGRTWGPNFESPTANLTQVHRQSAGNPIINLATRIRTRQNDANPLLVDPQFQNDPRLRIYPTAPLASPVAWLVGERNARHDATLIAWTNVLRKKMNHMVRQARGLAAESQRLKLRVVRSDRLAILRNHRASGMMNGEVFIVNASRGGPLIDGKPTVWVQLLPKPGWYLLASDGLNPMIEEFSDRDFRDLFEQYTSKWNSLMNRIEKALDRGLDPSLPPDLDAAIYEWSEAQKADQLCAEKAKGLPLVQQADIMANCDAQIDAANKLIEEFKVLPSQYPLYADYGECLTAHKAQGSQFKNVGVILDMGFDSRWKRDLEEARRWLYTAITRASQNLVIWKT